MSNDENKVSMIKELRPGLKNINLVFIIFEIGKIVEVAVRWCFKGKLLWRFSENSYKNIYVQSVIFYFKFAGFKPV